MRVGVGDSFSEVLKIVSGVLQGSVLGPILFLLFVNDLPDIKSRILLFADDLKLIADAMKKGSIDGDLRSLERWEGLWQLRFNLDKCKVLHISANDYILGISIIWMALSYFQLSLKKIWVLLWMRSLILVSRLKRL